MTRLHRLVACWLAVLVTGLTPVVGAEGDSWQPPQGFVEAPSATASELPAELTTQRAWSRTADGLGQHVVESTPRRQMSLAQYLALWRRSHGCAVKPARNVAPLAWAAEQQSLGGSCEGGDVFVMHVARAGGTFFEFHVEVPSGAPDAGEPQRLARSLGKLLAEVAAPLVVSVPSMPRDRRMSRSQAQRALERLPMVASLGENIRLHPLPDAADIGRGGCTGSAGECMYWFRAETRTDEGWVFFRLFAVCPYDGDTFVSTIADRQRAQRGGYRAVGPRPHGKSRSSSGGGSSAPAVVDERLLGPP